MEAKAPPFPIALYGLLEANDEPHIEKLKSILLETYYLYIFAKRTIYEKQVDQRTAPLDDSDDEMYIFPHLYTRLPITRLAFIVCPVTRVRCLTAIPSNRVLEAKTPPSRPIEGQQVEAQIVLAVHWCKMAPRTSMPPPRLACADFTKYLDNRPVTAAGARFCRW